MHQHGSFNFSKATPKSTSQTKPLPLPDTEQVSSKTAIRTINKQEIFSKSTTSSPSLGNLSLRGKLITDSDTVPNKVFNNLKKASPILGNLALGDKVSIDLAFLQSLNKSEAEQAKPSGTSSSQNHNQIQPHPDSIGQSTSPTPNYIIQHSPATKSHSAVLASETFLALQAQAPVSLQIKTYLTKLLQSHPINDQIISGFKRILT